MGLLVTCAFVLRPDHLGSDHFKICAVIFILVTFVLLIEAFALFRKIQVVVGIM